VEFPNSATTKERCHANELDTLFPTKCLQGIETTAEAAKCCRSGFLNYGGRPQCIQLF
jgi:hypothetical protein